MTAGEVAEAVMPGDAKQTRRALSDIWSAVNPGNLYDATMEAATMQLDPDRMASPDARKRRAKEDADTKALQIMQAQGVATEHRLPDRQISKVYEDAAKLPPEIADPLLQLWRDSKWDPVMLRSWIKASPENEKRWNEWMRELKRARSK
jgi:hypothetical protein